MENISYIGALLAGMASFFSPCVLPLIPAYIGYIAGNTTEETKTRVTLTRSIGFVIGFSIIFVIMGATASYLGQIFTRYNSIFTKFSGTLIIILGLNMLGLININALNITKHSKLPKVSNWFSSVLVGIAFAAGWTPCIGPILGSILLYTSATATLQEGMILLGLYSLGIGVPFIITSLLIDQFNEFLEKYGNATNYIKKIGGVIIIILGILIFFNKMFLLTRYIQ